MTLERVGWLGREGWWCTRDTVGVSNETIESRETTAHTHVHRSDGWEGESYEDP